MGTLWRECWKLSLGFCRLVIALHPADNRTECVDDNPRGDFSRARLPVWQTVRMQQPRGDHRANVLTTGETANADATKLLARRRRLFGIQPT